MNFGDIQEKEEGNEQKELFLFWLEDSYFNFIFDMIYALPW